LVSIFLCFLAALLFCEEPIHIVKKGETIYSIALAYGVSTEALMDTNSIRDPAKLMAGQKLKIPEKLVVSQASGVPSTQAADTKPAGFVEYKVVKNDTLFGIARKNGISVGDLLNFNNLPSSYMLKTGDTLRIPVFGAKSAQSIVDTKPDSKPPASAGKGAAQPETQQWPVTVKSMSKAEGKIAGGVIITSYAAERVRSLTSGIVKSAGPYLSYKNVVIVQFGDYLYIHAGCETLSVKQGDKVGPGTELGKLGTIRDPQLLFMVSRKNVNIDPATAPRE
jgi:LysM repeat protein